MKPSFCAFHSSFLFLDFLRDQLLAFSKKDSCEWESDKNAIKISEGKKNVASTENCAIT